MRQEQEQFRSVSAGAAMNPPLRWNHIDTSGEMGLSQRHSGARSDSRISKHLERFWTSQNDEKRIENNRESREEEVPRRTYVRKPDGFEPFINPEPQEDHVFINNYGGNFSQKMELNRKGVETVLRIVHLDGQVFLISLAPSRSRSAEAQGSELAAKRFLFFGEKTQKAEEENPYKRVVPVPEGWRIEINDQRITEELTEKEKLSGKELQRTFIHRFNGQLKDALKECVWREKCSSERDENFRWKVLFSSFNPTVGFIFSALHNFDPAEVAGQIGITSFVFSMFNIYDRLPYRVPSSLRRNIDHPWEFFMPRVEIDKVARTFAYLEGKGRRLVRGVQEER